MNLYRISCKGTCVKFGDKKLEIFMLHYKGPMGLMWLLENIV